MMNKIIDFPVKLVASAIIAAVGLFYALVVYTITLLMCFRDGYRNVFSWKNRTNDKRPIHYNFWDVETRHEANSSSEWNHAYVFVPKSGLRFHYVHSGTVPKNIVISEIDGETKHIPEDSNASTERPKLFVCLHGYPENWFAWRYILRFFDEPHPEIGNYFVVAPDMRGFGDSDKPSGYKSYHRNLVCSDIKGIASALGYKQFSIIGHDWGALIGYAVVENFSESVERLIILNGPEVTAMFKSVTKDPMQILKSWYIFLFQIPWVSELFVRLYDFAFVKEVLTGKMTGIRNSKNNLTNDELEMFKYGIREFSTAPISYYRSLAWPFAQPGPELLYPKESGTEDPFKKIPTLIIWGENDAFLTNVIPKITMERLDSDNGSKLVFLKNCSHWIQQDEPEEVIKHMVEFLKCR